MNITIGLVKNEQQVLLRSIDLQSLKYQDRIMDREGLKDELPQLIVCPPPYYQSEWQSFLDNEDKFYPHIVDPNIDPNNLDRNTIIQLMSTVHDGRILKYNLFTLENIFKITHQFKELWNHDRNAFIEEFWFFLKTNMGTTHLRILFHDLLEKGKLITASAIGTRIPQIFESQEAETMLLKEYEKHLENIFEVCEFDRAKGELVLTISINKSPLLIMANVYDFNPLQKALIAAICDGIQ